jgi:hypothetical protein
MDFSFQEMRLPFQGMETSFPEIKPSFQGMETSFPEIRLSFQGMETSFPEIKLSFQGMRLSFPEIRLLFRGMKAGGAAPRAPLPRKQKTRLPLEERQPGSPCRAKQGRKTIRRERVNQPFSRPEGRERAQGGRSRAALYGHAEKLDAFHRVPLQFLATLRVAAKLRPIKEALKKSRWTFSVLP